MDEYIKIGAETARQSLEHFVDGVIEIFGEEYLRRPNVQDMQRILHDGYQHGFPGMMGSVDCMQ